MPIFISNFLSNKMGLYHGTNRQGAEAIVTRVDVSLGGGELGQGFYTGNSLHHALALAIGRYGSNKAVVKLDISEPAYLTLIPLTISRRKYVFQNWRSYIKRRETQTHHYGYDVIAAPFATFDIYVQYKFESMKAENVLNNQTIKTML
jgi:hypothetical protein